MEEEQKKIRELLKKHNYQTSIAIFDKAREVLVEFPENVLKHINKKKMSVKYSLADGSDPEHSVLTVSRSSSEEAVKFFIPTYAANVLVLLDIISLCKQLGYDQTYSFVVDESGKDIPLGTPKDFFTVEEPDMKKHLTLTQLMISASNHNFSDDFQLIAQEADIEEGYLLVQKFGRTNQ